MNTIFKYYNNSYYETVCNFLIELSKNNRMHINWNWARWEWMVFHPDFNNDLIDKIGLWFCNDELVGMTTYDSYFGEAFFGVKMGFEELEKEVLKYAINTFSDENGLGIAVNDTDIKTIELLKSFRFTKNENTENILEISLDNTSFNFSLPKCIKIKNTNSDIDACKLNEMFWKGFNHEGTMPEDEITISKQEKVISAIHFNPKLNIVAENEYGNYVAYCGCWYNPKTDYAYVEPVCTIPEYRKKGIGGAVVMKALKECHNLGATKAYVISSNKFYNTLGFYQHSHFTFYWHKSNLS